MIYLSSNQAECVMQTSIPQINQHSYKFENFKFETLVKVLENAENNLYRINVIITEFGSITSKDIELSEFCKNFRIVLDYSNCL